MAQIPNSQPGLDVYSQADTPLANSAAGFAAIQNTIFNGEVLVGIWEGRTPGVRLLGITNRRLVMLESTTLKNRLALTSSPLAHLVSVGFLAVAPGESDDSTYRTDIDQPTAVAIKVMDAVYEIALRDAEEAREVHDHLAWTFIVE